MNYLVIENYIKNGGFYGEDFVIAHDFTGYTDPRVKHLQTLGSCEYADQGRDGFTGRFTFSNHTDPEKFQAGVDFIKSFAVPAWKLGAQRTRSLSFCAPSLEDAQQVLADLAGEVRHVRDMTYVLDLNLAGLSLGELKKVLKRAEALIAPLAEVEEQRFQKVIDSL